LLEATLQPLQVVQALQLRLLAEIHDAEQHYPVMKDVRAGLPDALQRKLSLNRSHAAETLQQLLLEGDVLRLRDGLAVVVIQRQVDFDASTDRCAKNVKTVRCHSPSFLGFLHKGT